MITKEKARANFATHTLKTPAECDCGGDTGRCNICDGGLSICKVCNAAEVELGELSCDEYVAYSRTLAQGI